MPKIKYKYRFKTEEEFISSFGENWKEVINGNWVGTRTRRRSYSRGGWYSYSYGYRSSYEYTDKGMDKFFGKKFIITKNERILLLEKGEKLKYHIRFYIHRDMLVCLHVPNYKPKKIKREI
jgi:hypothetical protein